ncbi:hypothetical protein L1049_024645 [Liquidambar formosana]|uniref:Core-2/I-branching beta-1,6-N-acetylglucosaminyltransferase family protein n=1 Tax=Liquidambar formosana TaxID=63359 RepID=A0AAP0S1C7_LIQFO
MTKKRPSSSVRHLNWFGTKLVLSLFVLLCFLALLGLIHHSHSKLQSSSSSIFTSRRSRSFGSSNNFQGPPKVAFLFLARRKLPLDFLWGAFFKNGDAANFTIYIHSEPGFVFNESTTRSAFFYSRQLSKSVQVLWGEWSMVEAEKLLLESALEDPANQRFVLLSDSCVPLYNFSHVYNYLMSSPRSFVDSFVDVRKGRYSPKMAPVIPKEKWRKGSQWIALVRKHAEVVVDDDIIFPLFKKFCKRWLPFDLNNGSLIQIKVMQTLQKQHNCIPDEHYVQTLLAMHGLEDELERRTLTYTLWNQSATSKGRRAWHPTTFNYTNAGPQQIKEIKDINHVYYKSEYRTEWCHTNSISTPCFLFARKFSRGAAMRLLTEGAVGSFDFTALWSTPP